MAGSIQSRSLHGGDSKAWWRQQRTQLDTLGQDNVLRSLDTLGQGNVLRSRSLDTLGQGNILRSRSLDTLGQGNLLRSRSLDTLGQGNILRSLDTLGQGNVLRSRSLDATNEYNESLATNDESDIIEDVRDEYNNYLATKEDHKKSQIPQQILEEGKFLRYLMKGKQDRESSFYPCCLDSLGQGLLL